MEVTCTQNNIIMKLVYEKSIRQDKHQYNYQKNKWHFQFISKVAR